MSAAKPDSLIAQRAIATAAFVNARAFLARNSGSATAPREYLERGRALLALRVDVSAFGDVLAPMPATPRRAAMLRLFDMETDQ